MFKADYKWKHDYVRLAFDSGFSFERHKTSNFDKNKISCVDIDRVIEERDFGAIESIIPLVTKFVLDPEQAQILDPTFVKTFHLSQLCIQYLLFCKKYLDNTLIIIKEEVKKVKEENKELNLFVEDLKAHIATLMKELDEKPTFKCNQCNKFFSSEDFLNSHIKRRHSLPVLEGETDKLQMEIKELKGRLNSAEKLIQKDTETEKESESKKIEDLQQKFEDLRVQVQAELKILQTQHNFQDKYDKLFEKMALQNSRNEGRRGSGEGGLRRESTTQTDVGVDEDRGGGAQKQMTEFGEALETKVTCSLRKIEDQMESFWTKLSEMERYKNEPGSKLAGSDKENSPVHETKEKRGFSHIPVKVVDRENSPVYETKEKRGFSHVSVKVLDKENSPVRETKDKHNSSHVPVRVEAQRKPLTVQSEKADFTDSSSDTVISEQPKPKPLPRKRVKSSDVIDDDLLRHFRVEVEGVIMGRLQDLGVSPEWRGLPNGSFQRALEIVNHQAGLIKKSHPNFDYISSQIEKTVTKKVEETTPKKKLTKSKAKKQMKGAKPPPIEIKNRNMYDTDSESEMKPKLRQFSAPYSAVIAELKTVTAKIESSDKEEVKNEETKGVLKSYPSVGSLTKKKVLFNLENEQKKDKDGGSSTSIASSVFDGTPRSEDKKKDKDKDIEDLSDFDFSDM